MASSGSWSRAAPKPLWTFRHGCRGGTRLHIPPDAPDAVEDAHDGKVADAWPVGQDTPMNETTIAALEALVSARASALHEARRAYYRAVDRVRREGSADAHVDADAAYEGIHAAVEDLEAA